MLWDEVRCSRAMGCCCYGLHKLMMVKWKHTVNLAFFAGISCGEAKVEQ